MDQPQPTLAQTVIYYDEDKQPCASIIVWIWPKLSSHVDLPICNLVSFDPDAKYHRKRHVEPAYKDPTGRWRLINKWAYRDTVPDDEWNYIERADPPRNMQVGNGEQIDTSPPRHARRIQN